MENKKRALFIDRDGTLIVEPPVDFQVDSLQKLEFIPGVLRNMHFIASTLDFELVMVTNQDGLGTPSFPTSDFLPPHEKMLQTFKGEGVEFDDIIIDRTFENEHKPTRKPGTGIAREIYGWQLRPRKFFRNRRPDYRHSIGEEFRCNGILLQNADAGKRMIEDAGLEQTCVLVAESWDCIADYLRGGARTAQVSRKTSETDIYISLDLDGHGRCDISTGLGFFDHMLNQIGRHSGFDLTIKTKGDLYVDEHHTVEDTALALGEALRKALGDKRGIERYGFVLPMDDCNCTVALDFGGRPWLVWNADFKRERIGDVPTEMFFHFFKSLSDAAAMNLYVNADGSNEHHKIEGIFKALARALRAASRRDVFRYDLPSTKGAL